MNYEHKGVIRNTWKGFWEAPKEGFSWKIRNLIIEKDEDKPEKQDR
jgi:hypothetical protein